MWPNLPSLYTLGNFTIGTTFPRKKKRKKNEDDEKKEEEKEDEEEEENLTLGWGISPLSFIASCMPLGTLA